MKNVKKNPKVLITNIVSLNTGDAAILWGTIEIIRKKYGESTEITVFDKAANAASKYYPWATFRQSLFVRENKTRLAKWLDQSGYGHWIVRLRLARFLLATYLLKHRLTFLTRFVVSESEIVDLQEYVAADLILSTGGTYLIENYNLASAIYDYRLSLATGAKLGFFTQTLGPFYQERNKSNFRKIFSQAAVILLRDEMSRRHILELGVVGNNVSLAADAAFVLTTSGSNKNEKVEDSNAALLKVAISVRSMNFFHEQENTTYLDSIASVTKVLVEEYGANVVFLSTCQGIPEYWADDSKIAECICHRLPANVREKVTVDKQFRQPQEIVEAYKEFDVIIATRMHAAILALCAGVPTLGIAYEFKMEELFKNIGIPEMVVNVAGLEKDSLLSAVKALVSQKELYRTRVEDAVGKMKNQAWAAIDALPFIAD